MGVVSGIFGSQVDPINDTAQPSVNTKDDGTSIRAYLKRKPLQVNEKPEPEPPKHRVIGAT